MPSLFYLETIFCQDIYAVGVCFHIVHIFAVSIEIFGTKNETRSYIPKYISEDILSLLVHIVVIYTILFTHCNGRVTTRNKEVR